MSANLIIGIDPDVEKSGVAVYSQLHKQLTYLKIVSFWELIEQTLPSFDRDQTYVIVEAGWLNKKSNYHSEWGPKRREKIAKDTGANHQAGKLIVEWLDRHLWGHTLRRPDPEFDRKLTADQFMQATGLPYGYNQEIRDAVRTLWPYRNGIFETSKIIPHVARK